MHALETTVIPQESEALISRILTILWGCLATVILVGRVHIEPSACALLANVDYVELGLEEVGRADRRSLVMGSGASGRD